MNARTIARSAGKAVVIGAAVSLAVSTLLVLGLAALFFFAGGIG